MGNECATVTEMDQLLGDWFRAFSAAGVPTVAIRIDDSTESFFLRAGKDPVSAPILSNFEHKS